MAACTVPVVCPDCAGDMVFDNEYLTADLRRVQLSCLCGGPEPVVELLERHPVTVMFGGHWQTIGHVWGLVQPTPVP